MNRVNLAIATFICLFVSLCPVLGGPSSGCDHIGTVKVLFYDKEETDYLKRFGIMDEKAYFYKLNIASGLQTGKIEATPAHPTKYWDVVESIRKRWPVSGFCENFHQYYATFLSPEWSQRDPKIRYSKISIRPGKEDMSEEFANKGRLIFATIAFTEESLGYQGKGFDMWSYHFGAILDARYETVYFIKNIDQSVGVVSSWQDFERYNKITQMPHYIIIYGKRAVVIKNDGRYYVGDLDKLIALNDSMAETRFIFNKVTSKIQKGIKALLYNREARHRGELYIVLGDDGDFYQLNIERNDVGGVGSVYLTASDYSNRDLREAILNKGALSVTTDGLDYYYALINITQNTMRLPQSQFGRYELYYGQEESSSGFDQHPNEIAAIYIRGEKSSEQYSYYYEEREGQWQVFRHKNGDRYENDHWSLTDWNKFSTIAHLMPQFIIPMKGDKTKGYVIYANGSWAISDIDHALRLTNKNWITWAMPIKITRCPTVEDKYKGVPRIWSGSERLAHLSKLAALVAILLYVIY